MTDAPPAYGLWFLVILNSAIFILFAFSFFKPQTKRDWRSFGAFSAFIVALFTEMYGFPLTIYLLSGWLQSRYPEVNWFSHDAGHLLEELFGWRGNPHFGPFHILSFVFIGGGFIALAGVAAETGVVMLAYLKHALQEQKDRAGREGRSLAESDLGAAVIGGALRRLRPLMMTVAAVIGGLLPIMFSTGTGSEVMRGIASPMVGGMASATVLTLALLPAAFLIRERRALRRYVT